MTAQLEADIRDALARRAAQIPGDVGVRLRGVDYRPRARRTSTLGATVGSVVGVAATAGIVSAVTLGGSQPAFAGWSPTPSAKAVLAADTGPEQTCLSRLNDSPPPPGGSTVTGPWSVVASDVRGPYTLGIYKSGSDTATCLTGPSITVISHSGNGEQSMAVQSSGQSTPGVGNKSSSAIAGRGSGDLTWYSEVHLNSADGELTLMDGQVASGVTAVTLVRSDGSQVQATIGNGWFVAWWPGDLGSSTADLTTAGGMSIVNLSALPTPPPPTAGPAVSPGPATCVSSPNSASKVCRSSGFVSGEPAGTGTTKGIGASSS